MKNILFNDESFSIIQNSVKGFLSRIFKLKLKSFLTELTCLGNRGGHQIGEGKQEKVYQDLLIWHCWLGKLNQYN